MAPPKNKRADRYAQHVQELTDHLIEALEKGTAPWQRPWGPDPAGGPRNLVSGRLYSGSNVLKLVAASSNAGYKDARWGTYKQIKGAGGQVRKGEKGTRITAVIRKRRPEDKEAPDKTDRSGEVVRVLVVPVFNAEQAEGLPPPERVPGEWDPCPVAQNILDRCGVPIRESYDNKAYYLPSGDAIYLPPKSHFPERVGYYQVAFHELAHATGHPSRMNRESLNNAIRSRELRAKEELRAEICGMLTGIAVGVGHNPQTGTAYVASWIKILGEDPMEVHRAARDAHAMSQYIIKTMGLEKAAGNEHNKEQAVDRASLRRRERMEVQWER